MNTQELVAKLLKEDWMTDKDFAIRRSFYGWLNKPNTGDADQLKYLSELEMEEFMVSPDVGEYMIENQEFNPIGFSPTDTELRNIEEEFLLGDSDIETIIKGEE
jgi:hypothetical protein